MKSDVLMLIRECFELKLQNLDVLEYVQSRKTEST